ncbi:hypothetical protein KKC60_01065 [Patescibacteria group bacterium]|nr:hypothetical protein [Patescibacteria group bacterium]
MDTTLIQISILGMYGFAMNPNISRFEAEAIIKRLRSGSRLAFIDLAPTGEMMLFLRCLSEARMEIVAFFDHHLNPSNATELSNVQKIRRNLGSRAVIKTRQEAFSCAGLVREEEWQKLELDAVFFHADPDGYLAFLKGCGLSYPRLELDADIFEGRTGTQSPFAKLLGDAQNNLPPYFSQHPEGHRQTLRRIYQTMADSLLSDGKIRLDSFREEVNEATRRAEELGIKIALEAQIMPSKVVYCDCLGEIEAGSIINFSALQAEVRRLHGGVLLCTTGSGHLGQMVFLQLPKGWSGKKINLENFLPHGNRQKVSRRAQIRIGEFSAFLQKWQEEFPDGP